MNVLNRLLTDVGLHLLPFAFLLYLPFRWLEYFVGGYRFHTLLNGVWYAGLAIGYIQGFTSLETGITMLMYISMLDGIFIYYEKRRGPDEEFEADPHPSYDYSSTDIQGTEDPGETHPSGEGSQGRSG